MLVMVGDCGVLLENISHRWKQDMFKNRGGGCGGICTVNKFTKQRFLTIVRFANDYVGNIHSYMHSQGEVIIV